MKKSMGLGALLLAGLLVIPGNLWLPGQALAQSGSKTITEKQYQELQRKRQEEYEYLEKKKQKQHPALRYQDASKRHTTGTASEVPNALCCHGHLVGK